MKSKILSITISILLSSALVATAAVHYVDVNSSNPTLPYTNWASAAATIQDAVDAAAPGDQVLVTNGIYRTGGRIVYGAMFNRVAATNRVTVESVNGPAVTTIEGYQVPGSINGDAAVRCVCLMANGASLVGFTLTNGATRSAGDNFQEQSGGGIYCASTAVIVSNCVLVGNSASLLGGGAYLGKLLSCLVAGNTAGSFGGGAENSTASNSIFSGNISYSQGGGAYGGSFDNCTFLGNSGAYGGGASSPSEFQGCLVVSNRSQNGGGGLYHGPPFGIYNCTFVYNSAFQGGGILGVSAQNCICYYNSATIDSNYSLTTPKYSCTTPLPTGGTGTITNEPLFVNPNAGNWRLSSLSPCINSGHNVGVTLTTDLDGRPRTVGGTVDMGAYEYQGPGMGEFIGWLQQYGLPTDGSADYADTDRDGMNNWQEWICGTDPTSDASVLKMLSPTKGPLGLLVPWESVTNRNYFVQRGTDLSAQPTFSIIATNIPGQLGTTSFTDTNATGDGPVFYRVGIQQ